MKRPITRRAFLSALAGAPLLACGGDDAPSAAPPSASGTPEVLGGTPGAGTPAFAALTWSSRAPLPAPRSEVASAVLDGKIYIIGGFLASGQSSDVVEVYDPAADRWEGKAALPAGRDHAIAAASNGRLFVFGGGLNQPTNTAFAYDPADDRWTRLAGMPFRRTSGGAAPLADRIIVVGGAGDSPAASMLYDPSLDRWEAGPALPEPREHLAVAAAGGKVYVIGGRWEGELKDTNEVLDSPRGVWQKLAPLPTARGGTAGGVVNARIYVAGGEAFSPTRTFPQVEIYDPASNSWSRAPDLPTPRHGLAVQGVGDTLYVIGGGPTAGLSASSRNEALSTR